MVKKDLIKRILIKYLVSYLAVLMIPVLISVVIYKNLVDLLVDDSMNANMAILEQSKIVLDRRMMELDSIAWSIAMNASVSNLLYSPSQTVEMVTDAFNTMKRDFYTYKVSNNFISNYFVYFKYVDSVATLDTLYKPKDYYDYFQKVCASWQTDYEEWYGFVRGEFANEKTVMTLKSNTKSSDRLIVFVYKLPLYAANLSLGSLGIIIDNEQLKGIVKNSISENEGTFYILDHEGKVVICAGSGTGINEVSELSLAGNKGTRICNINGRSMLVTYVESERLGWRYLLVVPHDSVMSKANNIRNIMLLIILLCFGIGIVVSVVFAYGNSKPLKYLLDDIGLRVKKAEQLPCDDTYGFIKGAFMQLAAESRVQEDTIKKQIPILTDNFYTKLIRGEIRNDDEIRRYELLLNLKLDVYYYAVVLLYVESFKSPEVAGFAIIGEVERFIFDSHYIINIDEKTTCLLLGFNKEDPSCCKEDLKRFAFDVRKNLYEKYEMTVTIAIGDACKDKKEIYRSYEEAVIALRYGQFKGRNSVILSGEVNTSGGVDYYYPPEEEVRLMNSVRAGNFDMVDDILDVVYEKNFVERHLKPAVAEYLANDLKSTLVKLMSELMLLDGIEGSFENVLKELKECNTGGETFSYIRKFFIDACSIINSKKRSHNDILKENIEIYMADNYTRQDLSLSSVAEFFNISEPYLSKFFTQHIGENFSVYLSRLRIKKAEGLLREGDGTIEQVSCNAGFGSVHVFIKVFKRYTGLTPGAYKNTFKS